MKKVARRLAVVFTISAGLGCAEESRVPTTPSANVELALTSSGTIDWSCARVGASRSSGGGLWLFAAVTQPCVTGAIAVTSTAAAVSGPPPSNFRSTVTGNTVRLDWDYAGTRDGFVIEAGSAPGLSNLARAQVPSVAPVSNFAVFGGVPAGVYHVRVRAFDSAGVGVPSTDIVVQVGGIGCTLAPGPPGTPMSSVSGSTVTLFWSAPPGDTPSSYVVEAGTGSGLSNAAVFDTGSSALSLSATAPDGRYYVRMRGRNACGTGPASSEHVLDVGTATPAVCPTSISPLSQMVAAGGGAFQVMVTAAPSCAWSATSTVSWLVISAGSGIGPGPVNYAVSPNSAASRSGDIRVSGMTTIGMTVTQEGGPTITTPPTTTCSYTVSPTTHSIPASGGAASVTVTTGAGCAWSVSSLSPFVKVSSAANATGPGTASFSVDVNSSAARTGTARIAWNGGSQDITLPQAATSALQAAFTVSADPCPVIASGAAYARLNCIFDASASTGPIVSYRWEFGDNLSFTTTNSVVKTLQIDCGFGGSALREVTLTVRDAQGHSHSVTKTIFFQRDSGC
jgi:hypothetical protein